VVGTSSSNLTFIGRNDAGIFAVDDVSLIEAPTISTVVQDATTDQPVSSPLPFGSSVFDTSTVTPSAGSPTATGIVTYNFYNTATPTLGTTSPVTTQNVTITGGTVPPSSIQSSLSAGSYSFIAVYNGDNNFAPSNGSAETFTVNPATTAAPATTATVTATVTATFTPVPITTTPAPTPVNNNEQTPAPTPTPVPVATIGPSKPKKAVKKTKKKGKRQ